MKSKARTGTTKKTVKKSSSNPTVRKTSRRTTSKRTSGTSKVRKPVRKKASSKKQKSRAAKSGRWGKGILKTSSAIAVVFFLWVFIEIFLLPDPAPLLTVNPETSSFMKRADIIRADQGLGPAKRGEWTQLAEISPYLRQAIIVSEDDAFYNHDGFDYREIKNAVRENLEERRFVRGASTITQQLAKNLYLSPSKNPLRKMKEVILTKRLESTLSKDRILEIYLNLIEWGDGIYGCRLACQIYFDCHPRDLNPEQAAVLAAMVPNPKYLDPRIRSEKLEWKKNWILKRLKQKGILK